MAASSLKFSVIACMLAMMPALSSAAAEPPAEPELVIESEGGAVFDYKNNAQALRKVRITRGDLVVQADAAEGQGTKMDFEDSSWIFRGNVQVTTARGDLRADNADVTFRDSQIATAVFHGVSGGAPATFEQKPDQSREAASGRAQTIEYDVASETVRLEGGAFLSMTNRARVDSQTIVYNIRDEKVLMNPDEQQGQRVRVVIPPKKKKDNAGTGTAEQKTLQ